MYQHLTGRKTQLEGNGATWYSITEKSNGKTILGITQRMKTERKKFRKKLAITKFSRPDKELLSEETKTYTEMTTNKLRNLELFGPIIKKE